MKNALKPLAKSNLIPLQLTATASRKNATIHKNIFGSDMTKLINLNKEINDVMKTVEFLEESSLLIKRVSETIKN